MALVVTVGLRAPINNLLFNFVTALLKPCTGTVHSKLLYSTVDTGNLVVIYIQFEDLCIKLGSADFFISFAYISKFAAESGFKFCIIWLEKLVLGTQYSALLS
jgi:hypothetical protein